MDVTRSVRVFLERQSGRNVFRQVVVEGKLQLSRNVSLKGERVPDSKSIILASTDKLGDFMSGDSEAARHCTGLKFFQSMPGIASYQISIQRSLSCIQVTTRQAYRQLREGV